MQVRPSSVLWCVAPLPFFAVLLTIEAQQPPELPLRIRETVLVSGQDALGFLQPVKCDVQGNLYARFAHPFGNYMASPVTKISRDGKLGAQFRIEAAPGFEEGATFDDFAVDLRGKVYLVATKVTRKEKDHLEVEKVLVGYDSDGSYNSTIKLDSLFDVSHVAAFPSGEFLLSGEKVELVDGTPRGTGRTSTALFDRHGKLIKEVELPEDVEGLPATREQGNAQPERTQEEGVRTASGKVPADPGGPKLAPEDFSAALSMGTALPADDGNIYLMRATPNPVIYVVSPGGVVVRQLQLMAPSGDSYPVSMQVAAGRIVILYVERNTSGKFKRHLFVVANAQTGETLAHYPDLPEIGGGLACYTPDGFVFLGNKGGQLLILRTYPY